jgi:hypothetical protein
MKAADASIFICVTAVWAKLDRDLYDFGAPTE